jgi:hypothetical protein
MPVTYTIGGPVPSRLLSPNETGRDALDLFNSTGAEAVVVRYSATMFDVLNRGEASNIGANALRADDRSGPAMNEGASPDAALASSRRRRVVVLRGGSPAQVVAQTKLAIDNLAPLADAPEPARLLAEFAELAAGTPLRLGESATLVVRVGAPGERIASFAFSEPSAAAAFEVQLHAPGEQWQIEPLVQQATLEPDGRSGAQARFKLTPQQVGKSQLLVSLSAAGQHNRLAWLWLPVEVVAADAEALPVAFAPETISFPLDQQGQPAGAELALALAGGTATLVAMVGEKSSSARVDGAQLAQAAQTAQAALLAFANTSNADGKRIFRDARRIGADAKTLQAALVPLATAGRALHEALFASPAMQSVAAQLRELASGTNLRIMLDGYEGVILWPLLYDGPAPLAGGEVDPEGFWGMRYLLELLPPGLYAAAATQPAKAVKLLLGDHALQDELKALFGAEVNLQVARNRKQALAALKPADPPAPLDLLIYHGGGETRTFQQLAGPDLLDPLLDFDGDLLGLNELRGDPPMRLLGNPLVMLNVFARNSSDRPFVGAELVQHMHNNLGARAVLWNSVEPGLALASDALLTLVGGMQAGQPLSKLIWALRRRYLLEEHTALGFAYCLIGRE